MRHIQIWHHTFLYQKILRYFKHFQNQSFSVLWLKRAQRMEMKQNRTYFYGTYSNLTPYLFLSKHIRVFQWLSKAKFLSFMTKVNPNNETKPNSDIFPWGIFKSGIISFFLKTYFRFSMTFKITISHFFDYNEPTQGRWNKIRQFFIGHTQIWHHFSLITKHWNISMTLIIGICEFHCIGEQR